MSRKNGTGGLTQRRVWVFYKGLLHDLAKAKPEDDYAQLRRSVNHARLAAAVLAELARDKAKA